MPTDLSSIAYLFPAPALASGEQIGSLNADSGLYVSNIGTISDKYQELFQKYHEVRRTILTALNTATGVVDGFVLNEADGTVTVNHEALKTIDEKKIDENSREGYVAYRFYLDTVAQKLKSIAQSILEASTCLTSLKSLGEGLSIEQANDQAHALVVRLECLDKFVYETLTSFTSHAVYNTTTRVWEEEVDDVLDKNSYNSRFSITFDKCEFLQNLREVKVENGAKRELSQEEIDKGESPYSPLQMYIEDANGDKFSGIFSMLTLVDKIKYIRAYYQLILKYGKTDYLVFPNNAETGYPCRPNVESTDPTKPTTQLGALEQFYVGYLVDRDGPVNAVASFFEVKSAALQANIKEYTAKIEALNIYLEFINRGLDLLNQSQSKSSKDNKPRIPDGTIIALNYLCGKTMYGLYEYEGTKYLVIPRHNVEDGPNVILVPANQEGMKMLLGDNANQTPPIGNSAFGLLNIHILAKNGAEKKGEVPIGRYEPTGSDDVLYSQRDGTNAYKYELPTDFVVPTQLDVATIIPESVKHYAEAILTTGPTDKDSDEWSTWTEAINSWTTAFSNKTQYINTAIDTINTDVSVDRTKIDTFDSMCSNFRSRAFDTYKNILNNVR